MSSALEARTHDPLWMLARQWQLGEFLGDDAGTPITANVQSLETPLNRYVEAGGPASSLGTMPLEARVEAEYIRPTTASLDYQQAVEAGLHFVRLLRAAAVDEQLVGAYIRQYAIAPPSDTDRATLDLAALRLLQVASQRVPDGVRLAADLRTAQPHLPPAPAIPAPGSQTVVQVVHDFLVWYDSLFDQPPVRASAPGAWVNERMEYAFTIDASSTDRPGAYVALGYTGEQLDWTSFDRSTTSLGPVTAPQQAVTRTLVPTPVTFKGMPARRFWEMELADVDLGAIEAGPIDLGRLMLRDFALIYGNDWFVVPLPVRVGSVCRISSLVVTDTFGLATPIPHYGLTADGGQWHMFGLTGDVADHALMMPPVLARSLSSDAIEQVLLVRDEAANMAWAVERLVQGAGGAKVDRTTAFRSSTPSPPARGQDALPQYVLGTSVPDYYIPFLAKDSNGHRRMKRAAFPRIDASRSPILPLGHILAPDVPLFEEEFAREGVRIERAFRLTRWTDGSTHLWAARRKYPGATSGSSGLRFDTIDAE